MRILLILFLLSLISCGKNSSPEGRMTSKLEEIRQEVSSLRQQNQAILDSISAIRSELNMIKSK
jgi:hypothetical protein